jgi:hypothetical protein
MAVYVEPQKKYTHAKEITIDSVEAVVLRVAPELVEELAMRILSS